jgi:hypothetical protein
MPISFTLCYNSSLVTWTAVSLTAAKFKHSKPNFLYDLRCQSCNSAIGINWFNLYLLYCYMFRPLSGHPQAKQTTFTLNYIGQCLQFFNICTSGNIKFYN